MFKKDCLPWNKDKKGVMPIPWNKGKTGIIGGAKKGSIPWNKNRQKVFCIQCEKEFNTKLSYIKRGWGKFCSRKCKYLFYKGKHLSPKTEFKKGITTWNKGKSPDYVQGSNHPRWKGGMPKCLDCGKQLRTYHNNRCKKCWHKYNSGENHFLWLGGKSFEPYGLKFNDNLKDSIRQRDNYKCQLCGCSQLENIFALQCHHIDYDKQNNISKNLVSLCNSCHGKTNGLNRKYWIKYFTNKIGEIYGRNIIINKTI